MQDSQVEQSRSPRMQSGKPSHDGSAPAAKGPAPHRRERQTVRLILGLAGLLGVAWAVAIVSRYPNLLAG